MLKPTYDNILVRVVYQPQPGTSLIIPDKFKKYQEAAHGEVLAIGSDVKLDLSVGDTVIFPQNEGYPVEVNEEKLLVLNQRRAYGVVE